ncbi:MAG: hypothetical protein KatS3mg079_775 [Caloramator sp.]|nr:MAG: hypothetical protein KatS3mg079_775 [Caloramator sp.]
MIVNDYEIYSLPVLIGKEEYPNNIEEELKESGVEYKLFNAAKIAEDVGNIKTQNMVILGALVKSLGLEDLDWDGVIRDVLPEKLVEINKKAFKLGLSI